jgi:hypothetical protein
VQASAGGKMPSLTGHLWLGAQVFIRFAYPLLLFPFANKNFPFALQSKRIYNEDVCQVLFENVLKTCPGCRGSCHLVGTQAAQEPG